MLLFLPYIAGGVQDDFRFTGSRRGGGGPGGRGCRGLLLRLTPEDLATNLAFPEVGFVVGSAHVTEDEIEDVLFLLGFGGFRLRLELGRAAWTRHVAARDESAAVRADEQEADLALLEDAVRVPIPKLGRMAEARFE